MLRKLILLVSCCFQLLAYGQHHGLISSFYQHTEIVNPSMIAFKKYPEAYGFQKNYSLHYNDMPTMSMIGASMPLQFERMAVGINLLREVAFVNRTLGINLNYSYRINFAKGRMSFGAKAGWVSRMEDLSNISYRDEESISSNYSDLKLIGGAGVSYKDEKMYFGLSAERSVAMYASRNGKLINQYFMTGSYLSDISHEWDLNSSIQLRYISGFPLLASLSLPLKYKDLILFAVTAHSSKTFAGSIGINLSKFIYSFNSCWVVYSYDQVLGKLMPVLGNTHELSVKLNLGNTEKTERINKRKTTISPVYF